MGTESALHELKKQRVWVGLKLFKNEGVADYVLFEPPLLRLHKLIHVCFVCDRLTLSLEESSNVVSEQVIGNNESFLAFLALLAGVGKAVRVIIVL